MGGGGIVNYDGYVEDYFVKPTRARSREYIYNSHGDSLVNPYNLEWDIQQETITEQPLDGSPSYKLHTNLCTLRYYVGESFGTYQLFSEVSRILADERVMGIDAYVFDQWTPTSAAWIHIHKNRYPFPTNHRGDIIASVRDTINCEYRIFFYEEYNDTMLTSDILTFGENRIQLSIVRGY